MIHHHAGHITVLRTISKICIAEPSPVHALLHSKVQHCFFLTVIYPGYTCQIRLFIISFQFINHVDRQIFQAGLHITAKELLTIHHNFLQFLTVNLHITIIINFRSGKFFHQFLQHGTFRRTISSRVIHQRIFHHLHLRCFSSNYCFGKHNSIRFECHCTHIFIEYIGVEM